MLHNNLHVEVPTQEPEGLLHLSELILLHNKHHKNLLVNIFHY